MTAEALAQVIELRPDISFKYERMVSQARLMVLELGVAETILTLGAVAREAQNAPSLLYDELSDVRERAWRLGVYQGLAELAAATGENT